MGYMRFGSRITKMDGLRNEAVCEKHNKACLESGENILWNNRMVEERNLRWYGVWT